MCLDSLNSCAAPANLFRHVWYVESAFSVLLHLDLFRSEVKVSSWRNKKDFFAEEQLQCTRKHLALGSGGGTY